MGSGGGWLKFNRHVHRQMQPITSRSLRDLSGVFPERLSRIRNGIAWCLCRMVDLDILNTNGALIGQTCERSVMSRMKLLITVGTWA